MTYKSGDKRLSKVFLDQDMIDKLIEIGHDPMPALREKFPTENFVRSTGNGDQEAMETVLKDTEAWRALIDPALDYAALEDRACTRVVMCSTPSGAPTFFEGESARLAFLDLAPPRFVPHMYPHQEEAMRQIRGLPSLQMEIESSALSIGDLAHRSVFDFECDSYRPLIINPRRILPKHFPNHRVWDEVPVKNDLGWGLDIRYKFAREDGKTHAQICKEELRTIKKRRKAAMKQLDNCGARYEAALKENDDVR